MIERLGMDDGRGTAADGGVYVRMAVGMHAGEGEKKPTRLYVPGVVRKPGYGTVRGAGAFQDIKARCDFGEWSLHGDTVSTGLCLRKG